MNASLAAAALLLALTSLANAQSFQGMRADAEGFALPEQRALTFPEDHGAHESFRLEWWYVTANLRGEDGQPYGVQWTLFRSALAPGAPGEGWDKQQAWMAHAALSSADSHYFDDRLVRGGLGLAGVIASPFEAWIDEWSLSGPTFDTLSLRASGRAFAYDLELAAEGPLVMHGKDGLSVKTASGQSSHYYSQPYYNVTGTVMISGSEPVAVSGQAWLDREWSSEPLEPNQTGWDWAGLHLDDGAKLMVGRIRDSARRQDVRATWVSPDGVVAAIDGGAIMSPIGETTVAGRDFPLRWRFTLPDHDVDLVVEALNPDTYMATAFPYWEGPVTVSGSHQGVGYLELTGY